MKKSMMLFKSQGTGSLTVGVCTLLFSMGSAQAGFAQQTVAARPVASPAISSQTAGAPAAAKPVAEEEEAAKSGKPGGEGIKVHGHWVMDIKNPDGTLVKHLDFQNSLTTGGGTGSTAESTGDQLIAAVLSGTGVVTDPGIYFLGATPALATFPANTDITSFCSTATAKCGILTTSQSMINLLGGLVPTESGLSARVNFSPSVSWVLSGAFYVPSGMTTLTAVQVGLPLCIPNHNLLGGGGLSSNALAGSWADMSAASLTSGSCNGNNINAYQTGFTLGPLTSTYVPNAPLTTVPGQIIQVTVTLSFS